MKQPKALAKQHVDEVWTWLNAFQESSMLRQVFTVLLVVFIIPLSQAVAQQSSSLALGERVRIHTVDSERIIGHVEFMRDDALFLSPESGYGQLEVPLRSISGLEVRRRASRGQGAGKWAKRGFAAGAVAGALVCGVDVEQCRESPEMADYEIILGSALFIGGGVALLAAIGGAAFPGSYWERISVPSHVHLMPDGNGGLRLSASWRF